MKDLLVHMDDAIDSRVQLEAGLWLAEKYQAHMSALYAPSKPILYYGSSLLGMDVVDTKTIEVQFNALKEQAKQAKQLFQTVTDSAYTSTDYQTYSGEPRALINKHSAYFDLLVVGQNGDRSLVSPQASMVDSILLESSCPVLVVPQQETPLSIGSKVLIAWNGSREAACAMHNALPFLLKAERVDVVMVLSEGESEAWQDTEEKLTAHLSQYGITPNVIQLPERDGREPAETILSEGEAREVNLIVMGAYGHSRLREIFIGGATRYMLENSTIPLLMSH